VIPSTYLCAISYTQFHQSSLPRNPWTLTRRKLHFINPKLMASPPKKVLLPTKKQQRSKRTLLSQPSKKPKDPQSKSPSYLVPKSSLIPKANPKTLQPSTTDISSRQQPPFHNTPPKPWSSLLMARNPHFYPPQQQTSNAAQGKELSVTRPPEGPAKRSTKRL